MNSLRQGFVPAVFSNDSVSISQGTLPLDISISPRGLGWRFDFQLPNYQSGVPQYRSLKKKWSLIDYQPVFRILNRCTGRLCGSRKDCRDPSKLPFRPSVTSDAFTRGPVLKRSGGMGNVRASSDGGIGSAQSLPPTYCTKLLPRDNFRGPRDRTRTIPLRPLCPLAPTADRPN